MQIRHQCLMRSRSVVLLSISISLTTIALSYFARPLLVHSRVLFSPSLAVSSMAAPSVLVTGATGRQGGAVIRALLSSAPAAKVHALVRDPFSPAAQSLAAQGVTLHRGNFADVPSLRAAFSSIHKITAVFLNTSPSSVPGLEVSHAANVIFAAKAAGTVTAIIYTSLVACSEHASFPNWSLWSPESFMHVYFTSKSAIETLVRESGIPDWTVLRPPTFMTNYVSPGVRWFFPEVISQGVFYVALEPDTRTLMLDPEDIGACAVAVFLDSAAAAAVAGNVDSGGGKKKKRYAQRTIDIGADRPTAVEIAEALSRVSGPDHQVRYVRMPQQDIDEKKTTHMGIAAQTFWNERSARVDPEDVRKDFPDVNFSSFEQFVRRNADVVKAGLANS